MNEHTAPYTADILRYERDKNERPILANQSKEDVALKVWSEFLDAFFAAREQ